MAANSKIEWCDATWNPTVGCARVSEGCRHCYAERMAKRLAGMARADLARGKDPGAKRHYLNVLDAHGRWNGRVELAESALQLPLRWKRPRRIFVDSESDLFYEAVPFDFVDRVFAVMALCPRHTFQILTKRPERMAEYLNDLNDRSWRIRAAGHQLAGGFLDGVNYALPLANVWLATSVESRAHLDRVMTLSACPAAVRFWSLEPLLEDLGDVGALLAGVDWVIVGGESGPGARACRESWIASIVDQCRAAGVPCFVKQMGAVSVADRDDVGVAHMSKYHDKKGGDLAEFPADLRVRELPNAVA